MFLEETDPFRGIDHLFIHALTQGIQHLISGLDTGISAEQQRLEILENFRSQRVVAKVLQQSGDEALTGLLHAAPQSAQPVDLLQRNLIDAPALSRQNFSRPEEVVIERSKAGLRGVLLNRSRRRLLRFHRDGALVQLLLTLLTLGRGLLQQGQTGGWRRCRGGFGFGFRLLCWLRNCRGWLL